MKAKEYFSHNLKVNLQNGQGRVTDKKPWQISYAGMFFAALFVCFGFFELFSNIAIEKFVFDNLEPMSAVNKIVYASVISPIVFDIAIIALGLFAFIRAFLGLLRYRKIIIDNGKVNLTYRNAMGKKRTTNEKISNYLGVGSRVEFFQIGFITKNRYIIELVHKDYKKNIPLYITTSSKDIRKMWEDYAVLFKLPCAENTENGLEFIQIKDFGKSIIQQNKEKIIQDDYDPYAYLPWAISYVRKKDKIVLKAKKLWFDIFNVFLSLLALMVCIFAAALGSYTLVLVIVLISSFLFLKKDKLVIKKQKLVKVDKYAFFSRKVNEIEKKDIKAINVTYNPVTNRYFIAIYSNNKVIIFAKKMPEKDLKWVRRFLIHEIIR